jgi:ketosteroid isomerase-like protein
MSDGFDAMAVAVDWLDAYRAAKVDALLDLYDDEASIECACDGQKIIVGRAALRQYWIERLAQQTAIELDDIVPTRDGVALAYHSSEGLVRVVFSFNAAGKIARTHCGPRAEITPFPPASR